MTIMDSIKSYLKGYNDFRKEIDAHLHPDEIDDENYEDMKGADDNAV